MATDKDKTSKLERIKENISDSRQNFSQNHERYNRDRKFTFETTLSDDDITSLKEQQKPQLEFNIIEPFLQRQMGEFAKQEPNLEIKNAIMSPGSQVDQQTIDIVEGHIKCIFFDSNRDNAEYDIALEQRSGGFSCIKVYTDYADEGLFLQNIYFSKVFDPTLCGFDKFARDSHKGDGEYCFELFPMRRQEFEDKYGKEHTDTMKFTRSLAGFNWSYTAGREQFVLVGDYYEKEYEDATIVQLLDGQVLTKDQYKEFLAKWDRVEQPPAVIGERKTKFTKIRRYILCENAILGEQKGESTDYKYLPLVFVDGNSVILRESQNGAAKQLTRPMLYHAKGVQKLKNYAGNTIANDIENLVQHKFMLPKDAIPTEYLDAWINPQKPSTLIYNMFKGEDPTQPLNKPEAVPRVGLPQEVFNTFTMTDQLTQTILGSYDASIGINGNQISGAAISQGAMMSNAASEAYNVNYMKALNRVAEHFVDLIPKYYKTPRTIPVRNKMGQRDYVEINTNPQNQMEYKSNALSVRVEAGVNFEVQRERSFVMLNQLMGISPTLNELIGNTEPGLEMLLDNIDIRGIDNLKQIIKPFLNQKAQQAQQAQQMQQQMNPIAIKQQELKIKAQQNQADNALKSAEIEVDQEKAATDRILALAKIGEITDNTTLKKDEFQQEEARIKVSEVNAMTNAADVAHRHAKEILDIHHTNTRHGKDLDHAKELAEMAAKNVQTIQESKTTESTAKRGRGRPKKASV